MTRDIKKIIALLSFAAWMDSAMLVCKILSAEVPKQIPVEEVLRARSFAPLMPVRFSPDGQWLAYTVKGSRDFRSDDSANGGRAEVPEWLIGNNIYIANTTTGESRSLPDTGGDQWLPTWAPNSRYIAFLSGGTDPRAPALWLWDVRTNSLRRVCNLGVRADQLEWTRDSDRVVLTVSPAESPNNEGQRAAPPAAVSNSLRTKARGATVVLFQTNAISPSGEKAPSLDPWSLDGSLRDVIAINIRTRKAASLVQGRRVSTFSLSPDGSRIAYTVPKRFERPGSQQILFDLAVTNILTGEEHVMVTDVRLEYDGASFSWSPDSKRIALRLGGVEELRRDCYVADVERGTARNVSMFPKVEAEFSQKSAAPLWDARGEHVYFVYRGRLWRASPDSSQANEVAGIAGREIRQTIAKSAGLLWMPEQENSTVVVTHDDVEKQDGFSRIDLDSGTNTKLLERGQCFACVNAEHPIAVSRDGQRAAFFAEDAEHDADLWISAPDFHNPRRLTHLNPQFDEYPWGKARLIQWLSDDGEQMEGALLLPSGYKAPHRYPLVVWVYGGASLADNLHHFGLGYRGPFNLQLLATRGYAVLLPNAPVHAGTPMLDLAKTVLPGINKVIELGVADRDRIGVMGHSFGGYSTLALITETRRFKAAIEIAGLGDLVGDYGAMDPGGAAFGISVLEHGQGSMEGTPWEYRDRYIENSPFFYLDRVETPLLIIAGTRDTTVPSFLSDQVFVGLRRLQKQVEYAKYEGEGHSLPFWNYPNQVDVSNRMIAWLQTHLK
jgi:dipeptidyl aminopeptidase/acylaminoacyl peptidase